MHLLVQKRAEEKKAKAEAKERRLKSMEKHQKLGKQGQDAIPTTDSDDGSDINEESQAEKILLLNQTSPDQKWSPMTDSDVDFVASLKWLEYMMQNKQFIACLREFPTMDSENFSKDELAQVYVPAL